MCAVCWRTSHPSCERCSREHHSEQLHSRSSPAGTARLQGQTKDKCAPEHKAFLHLVYSRLLLAPTWNMFCVATQLDLIMAYAVFLAKKAQLHFSGTTGVKVCSSKTSIFHLQRPYSFQLQKPYFFHQFSSSKWSVKLL